MQALGPKILYFTRDIFQAGQFCLPTPEQIPVYAAIYYTIIEGCGASEWTSRQIRRRH